MIFDFLHLLYHQRSLCRVCISEEDVDCTLCDGRGCSTDCKRCESTGKVSEYKECPNCTKGVCYSGTTKCSLCKGLGYGVSRSTWSRMICPQCEGATTFERPSGRTCPKCVGSGTIAMHKNCNVCNGTGSHRITARNVKERSKFHFLAHAVREPN